MFTSIENLTKLRETVSPDDFILTKYLAKLMVGYFPDKDEQLLSMFEQEPLKKIHERA